MLFLISFISEFSARILSVCLPTTCVTVLNLVEVIFTTLFELSNESDLIEVPKSVVPESVWDTRVVEDVIKLLVTVLPGIDTVTVFVLVDVTENVLVEVDVKTGNELVGELVGELVDKLVGEQL
ncbi:hypothetical protein BB558_007230 [Smittium angustum]|uniref:Uncharacterized protein n=1 Tax=Smittium angustum TaxID=133377 RepID=A0A2U1IVL7_SMIAN|nr:hypothetical protein BB558_007230 [Smittium angustum]